MVIGQIGVTTPLVKLAQVIPYKLKQRHCTGTTISTARAAGDVSLSGELVTVAPPYQNLLGVLAGLRLRSLNVIIKLTAILPPSIIPHL